MTEISSFGPTDCTKLLKYAYRNVSIIGQRTYLQFAIKDPVIIILFFVDWYMNDIILPY